jgi:hypothetical protein
VNRSDHDRVTAPQRPLLHQDGRHRTAAPVELRLEHHTFGATIRVGPRLDELRLEGHRLEKLFEARLPGRRDLHGEHLTPELFRDQTVLHQPLPRHLRVGVGEIALVQSHHDRDIRRPGVIDRLDGLRHDALGHRNHQNHEVGHLGAAGPHGGECGVTRSIDERERLIVDGDPIGADVLSNASGFAGHHVGPAQGVE